ncbi:hypothetical protein ABE527_03035 [Brucella sp. TWI432]
MVVPGRQLGKMACPAGWRHVMQQQKAALKEAYRKLVTETQIRHRGLEKIFSPAAADFIFKALYRAFQGKLNPF